MCSTAGAPEVGDFRASSLPTLVEMVAGGVGITLLPMMAVASTARSQPNIMLVPFRRPAPFRTIGLLWRRSSPRVESFTLLGEAVVRAAQG